MSQLFWRGILVLLSACHYGRTQHLPKVSFKVECRERYFSISTGLLLAENEPLFEAVDALGVHPITKQYGMTCGYTFSVMHNHVEFRASYFSCHTDNKADEVFTFNFNVIMITDGKEAVHTVNQSCSPSLPWSHREVTCEEEYMEVTVKRDVSFPSVTTTKDWNAEVHDLATADWQVVFQSKGRQPSHMYPSNTQELGYRFDVSPGRLLFRSPYGQPHAVVIKINDLSLEVINPTVYFRQNWVVTMVDLMIACSIDKGSYEGSMLVWETPFLLPPLVSDPTKFESLQISTGVNGNLQAQNTLTCCTMEVNNDTVRIGIPFRSCGGSRKSFVQENVYNELYVTHLYYEHVFVTNDQVVTRFRQHKPMGTPRLTWHPFTIDQTVIEERIFIVYLGKIPLHVDLAAVKLNGKEFTLPLAHTNLFSISNKLLHNGSLAFILRVPFEDSLVSTQYSEEGILKFSLDITYTLQIKQQKELYYHMASVEAVMKDVFPPTFVGDCYEDGVRFTLEHQPFDYMWDVGIGPYPLTPELAAQRGYIMKNDSQSLVLDVPLFTLGYRYEDINLNQFIGSFEILSREVKTQQIQLSSTKRCRFNTTELIDCSTHGVMTLVTNLSKAIHNINPSKTSLLHKNCKPKEVGGSRVRFQFMLNSCGTQVKVHDKNVTYENEIIYENSLLKQPAITRNTALRVIIQCIYPISGLHRLFAEQRFVSETSGQGMVVYTKVPRVKSAVIKPFVRRPSHRPNNRHMSNLQISSIRNPPINILPARHPPAEHILVSKWHRKQDSKTDRGVKDIRRI